MSQPNSQNLYYPRDNGTNFGIYGAPSNALKRNSNVNLKNARFTPKYNNHAKLIQEHIDQVNLVKVTRNSQNTSMYEDLTHYEEIEKIAKDRQQLILSEIQAHNRGSKRKTRRKH